MREGSDANKILWKFIETHVKQHGDGNPTFTLDQFDHWGMKAVPAVFRSLSDWDEYVNNLSERDFREMEAQIYAIKDKLVMKWKRGFGQ